VATNTSGGMWTPFSRRQREKIRDRMCPWKANPAIDQDGLDGFLGSLLGIKAEIFEQNVGVGRVGSRAREVAAGPAQPLGGVIGIMALRHHRRLAPLRVLGR